MINNIRFLIRTAIMHLRLDDWDVSLTVIKGRHLCTRVLQAHRHLTYTFIHIKLNPVPNNVLIGRCMMYEVKTFYKPIRKADQSVVPKIFFETH